MATYTIISHAGSGSCLNIASSSSIANGTNVNVYAATGSNDQKWVIDSLSSTGEQFIKHFSNNAYALNARRVGTNWNCTLYTATGNADGYLIIESTGASGIYTIRLSRHTDRYLTAEGTSNSSNVSWQTYTGSTAQQWKITPVNTVIPISVYSTATHNGVTFHVIKTAPTNIVLKNLARVDITKSSEYGINAAFFTTDATDDQFYNIAANNGVLVGPSGAGDYNGDDCGSSIIAYHNGTVKLIDDIKTHNEAKQALGNGTAVWVQGGQNLYLGELRANWEDKWKCGITLSKTSNRRTYLIIDTQTNDVYLIAAICSSYMSTIATRSALLAYLGITDTNGGNASCRYQGLMLDGGGSTSMRAMNSSGAVVTAGGGRKVNQIIALKQP